MQGDVVPVKEYQTLCTNSWSWGRIAKNFYKDEGEVHVVDVCIAKGIL